MRFDCDEPNFEIEGMPKCKAIIDSERGLYIVYLETKIDDNTTDIKIMYEIKIGEK
jgi:hypothetical protein